MVLLKITDSEMYTTLHPMLMHGQTETYMDELFVSYIRFPT